MEKRMKGLILATASAIALGIGGAGTAHALGYSGSTPGPHAQAYYPNFSSYSGYMNYPRYIGTAYRPGGVVARAQLALRRDGLYHGNIDGNLGPETTGAIRDFQQQHGFPATGSLNPMTVASLLGHVGPSLLHARPSRAGPAGIAP
jgi:hypothetical protein